MTGQLIKWRIQKQFLKKKLSPSAWVAGKMMVSFTNAEVKRKVRDCSVPGNDLVLDFL